MSGAITPDAQALQHLRAQLHPDLQRQYPELLTAVAPPTRRDVLDVLEMLEALAYGGGRNACEFAMEVISSLVAMIDLQHLALAEPANNTKEP